MITYVLSHHRYFIPSERLRFLSGVLCISSKFLLIFYFFAFTIPVHETSTCIVFVRTNTQKSGIAKLKHVPYQIIQTSIWRNISNVMESCRTNIVNLLPWTNLELGHSNLKKRRSLMFLSCPPSRQILACGAFDSYARLLNNTTVKPVCNDHLYNNIYNLWLIQ